MEQRQTAPAQDTERAVVDLETFERVWRRVMPNQDMSPIQVELTNVSGETVATGTFTFFMSHS